MPAIPDLLEPLTDGTVSLRLPAEWDIPEILIAHQDDPNLFTVLGMARPPSGAELGRAVEQAPANRAAGTSAALTIVQAGDDDCIGQVDVHNIRWQHQRAELGIWVAPALRGQGIARRALVLAAGWLFDTCGLERLALLTEPGNAGMLSAARAAGFLEEGILRSYGREQGRRVDLALLSLLPGDR